MNIMCDKKNCVSGKSDYEVKKLEQYKTSSFGLPMVLFNSVDAYQCKNCDEILEINVPDPEGLMLTAALARIINPYKLNGKEIQFLRKVLDLKASSLAQALEVTPETISRWENDQRPINSSSEKLLRMIVAFNLLDDVEGIDFDLKVFADMKTKGFRSEEDEFVMEFELMKVRDSKSRTTKEVYGQAQAKVA